MNVFVQRAVNRFGALDETDAVAFAETVLENARRVLHVDDLSGPSRRELNLALVFLNLRFPFQCCGARHPEPPCQDCPMDQLGRIDEPRMEAA